MGCEDWRWNELAQDHVLSNDGLVQPSGSTTTVFVSLSPVTTSKVICACLATSPVGGNLVIEQSGTSSGPPKLFG